MLSRLGINLSKEELRKTIIFYLFFLVRAMIISVPGPTLVSLQQNVKAQTSDMGIVFTFRSIGFLVGAFLCGIVLDRVKKTKHAELVLIVQSLCMVLTTLGIPFCTKFWQLQLVIFLSGAFVGGLDNGINVSCLHMWGDEIDRYYQALHFFFALGGFLGPLVAAPFLDSTMCNSTCNNAVLFEEFNTTSIKLENGTYNKHYKNTDSIDYRIVWPYVIVSSCALAVTIIYAAFCLTTNDSCERDGKEDALRKKEQVIKVIPYRGRWFAACAVVLSAIAIFFSCGIEVGYAQMLSTYAVHGVFHMSKSAASYLTSLYWGSYMATRFVSVILSAKFKSQYLVVIDAVISVCAGLVLTQVASRYAEGLWIGTAMIGIGVASMYPSVLAWLGRSVDITFKIGAVFVTTGSIAEMTVPLFLGAYVNVFPSALFYYILGASLGASVIFIALWLLFQRRSQTVAESVVDEAAAFHRATESDIPYVDQDKTTV